MKKLLSVSLTAVLLLTTALSVSLQPFAVTHGTATSNELLNTAEKTGWLQSDEARLAADATLVAEADGYAIKLGEKNCSLPILASNNISNTDLEAFEWQFDYVSDRRWARTEFYFHVDSANSTYSNLITTNAVSSKKLFGIGVLGFANSQVTSAGMSSTEYGIPTTGYRPNGLTIKVPSTSDGSLRPVGGTSVTPNETIREQYPATKSTGDMYLPSEEGFICFDADAEDNLAAIDIGAYLTINIKLDIDGLLTVSVWQTDNKDNTLRTLSYQLDSTSYHSLAESGDFVVSNGNNWAKLKNMSIKEISLGENTTGLIFDSTQSSKSIDKLFVPSNPDATQTGSTVKVASTWDADKQAAKLNNNFSSTNILKENGYNNTNLTDFVWEIEYMPQDVRYAQTHFVFHAADASMPTGSKTGASNIKNALGISIHGNNTAGDYIDADSIRVNCPNSSGIYGPAAGYTYTTDKTYKKAYSIFSIGTVEAKWYTIRISLKDRYLLVEVWKTDAGENTKIVYHYEFTEVQMNRAPSGDFAVLNGNTGAYIKSMKIWKGADTVLTSEDYSAYDSVAPTVYDFAEDTQGIAATNDDPDVALSWDSASQSLKLTTGENYRVYTSHLDNGNNKLGDFIIKYDFKNTHNWTNDYLYFRVQANGDKYGLQIVKDTGANTYDSTSYEKLFHKIKLVKVVDDEKVELGVYEISKTVFVNNNDYTIKLEAIGNNFKVYIGPKGSTFAEPVLDVTDSSFTTGLMYYSHLKNDVYLDNIYIYDIDASEFEDKITATSTSDRAGIRKLAVGLESLSAVQQGKVSKSTVTAAEAELEKKAMMANEDDVVDIRDLIRIKSYINNSNSVTIPSTCNPHLEDEGDAVINDDDIIAIRKYILGIRHY